MSKMRFFALQELASRKPVEVSLPSDKLNDYYGIHHIKLFKTPLTKGNLSALRQPT